MAGRAQQKSGKTNEKPRRRGWWWRILLALLLLVVLVSLVFHQLFLQEAVKKGLNTVAEQQKLDLDYELERTDVLDRLILKNVRLEREESSRFPLKTLVAERIILNYDLGQAVRRNWAAVLEGLTLKNATAVIEPVEDPPAPKEPREKDGAGPARTVVSILQQLEKFQLPVVDLNNVTLQVFNREEEKIFAFRDLRMELEEDKQGPVRIPELKLPTGAVLEDIRAEMLYSDYRLILRDFVIPGAVDFRELVLDLSDIGDQQVDVHAQGEAFEAEIATSMTVMRENRNLGLDGTVSFEDFNLDQAKDLLDLDTFPRGRVESLDIYLRGNPLRPDELFARVELQAGELSDRGVTLENVVFRGKLEDGSLTIQTAEASTRESTIEAIGWARLNEDEWKFSRGEAHLFVDLDSPDIAQILDPERYHARGSVDLETRVRFHEGKLVSSAGEADLREFSYRDYHIHQAFIEVAARENVVYAEQLLVWLTPENRVDLTGRIALDKPHAYRVAGEMVFDEVAALRKAVFPEGMNPPLPVSGSLEAELAAEGEMLEPETHHAEVRISGHNLQPAQRPAEGEDGLAVLGTRGDYRFRARAEFKEQRLTIPALRVGVGDQQVLYLKGQTPVNLPPKDENTPWIPEGDDIDLSLRIVKTPIQELVGLAGIEAPVTGSIEAEADLRGSLESPRINLLAAGEDIDFPDTDQIQPAEVLLRAQHEGRQLQLTANIDQPQVEPIRLQLISPVTLEHFTSKEKSLAEVPVEAQFNLPRTELGFLQEFFPDLQLTDSRASAQIAVNGSFGNPQLEGELALAAARVGYAEEGIPALEALRLNLRFDGREIGIKTFSAAVSGGKFEITGAVDLGKNMLGWSPKPEAQAVAEAEAEAPEEEEPQPAPEAVATTEDDPENPVADIPEMTLDLQVTGEEMLLFRDDKLILRTNADLQVTGPLRAANIAGELALTTSRYYQEFNLLPLRLPGGQRVSRPPSPGGGSGLSIREAPFRDWTFDVDIKTAQPFLLQGNVAQGSLVSRDLAVRGSGKNITLIGSAEVRNFKLILPFSTIEANSGTLTFRPDEIFNPELNVTGRTNVKGRQITLHAFGRLMNPETSFSSSPPMTEEQILTLLATGATPSEFTGEESTGAQRALVYAANELYRKIFGGRPGINQDLFGGAISLESEGVNPATGEERTTATLDLHRNLEVRTSVETDGTFRGVLQYMIRLDD